MEILSKIFEVVNNKISLPVAILSGFLAFGPKWLLDKMDVSVFASSSRPTIMLVFLFSGLLYTYEKSKRISEFFKRKRTSQRKRKLFETAMISHLDGLSLEEEYWIYFCPRDNTRTVYATQINPTAVSLESKGIVYRPTTPHDILATPFTLRKEVWNYLVEHREEFCTEEQLNNAQYNAAVNAYIRELRRD